MLSELKPTLESLREKKSRLTRKALTTVDGPWWTWRGTPSESDRYYKRGMRIDYTCVSRSLVPRIHEAVISESLSYPSRLLPTGPHAASNRQAKPAS